MASIKIKFRPSMVEGKKGTIYFQIIHNRVIRQINTGFKVERDDWDVPNARLNITKVMSRKDIDIINSWDNVRFDFKRLQLIVMKIESLNSIYSVEDIVAKYAKHYKCITLFGFTLSVIKKLKQSGSISNAENYFSMLSSFMTFRRGEDIMLKELDGDIIECYEGFLKHKGNGMSLNTISFYMRTLRSTINRAIEKDLMPDKNLFKRVRTKMEKTAKRAVPIDYITKIKSVDLEEYPDLALSRDLFLFSFYTRGMSFVDIAYLKKRDLKNGEFTYRRSKTGQAIRVAWEPCMEEIAMWHNDPNSEYMLPIITNPTIDPMLQYISMRGKVSRHLKKIALLAGIPHNITMYVARHTWASVAKANNISISVISEAMGHDSETTTRIYLASLDTAIIDNANRLIIGSV